MTVGPDCQATMPAKGWLMPMTMRNEFDLRPGDTISFVA
jgi:hypothetical protein